jgi:hypothetical protein
LAEVRIGTSVTTINNNAFRNCTALTSIVIPDNVVTGINPLGEGTGIGFEAFQGCTSLREIVLGSGITHIERNTFNGCTSLESVTFSKNLEEINNFAFFGATALKEIDLPESVTRIHNHAFAETGLVRVTIRGQRITRIGWRAFADNPYLTEVRFTSVRPPDEFFDLVFDNSPNVALIVPFGGRAAFLERWEGFRASPWSGVGEFGVQIFEEGVLQISAVNAAEGYIELHNPNTVAVSARGLHLGHDGGDSLWQLPAVIVRAGTAVRVSVDGTSDSHTVLKRMQTDFDLSGGVLLLTTVRGDVLERVVVD